MKENVSGCFFLNTVQSVGLSVSRQLNKQATRPRWKFSRYQPQIPKQRNTPYNRILSQLRNKPEQPSVIECIRNPMLKIRLTAFVSAPFKNSVRYLDENWQICRQYTVVNLCEYAAPTILSRRRIFRAAKIRFLPLRSGGSPGRRWRSSLQRSPDIAGLRGSTSKGMERRERRTRGEERGGKIMKRSQFLHFFHKLTSE